MNTDEEIEGMRVACKLGREVLDAAASAVDVGVTTDELDRIVHEAAIERDCYPSPLGYYKFPVGFSAFSKSFLPYELAFL